MEYLRNLCYLFHSIENGVYIRRSIIKKIDIGKVTNFVYTLLPFIISNIDNPRITIYLTVREKQAVFNNNCSLFSL